MPLLCVFDAHVGGAEDGIVTGFFLAGIVVEDTDGLAAHAQDDDDIDQGHEAHEDVGQIPDEVKAGAGAEKDHDDHGQSEQGQEHFAVFDEEQIGLGVVIIADDGAEGKGQDSEGEEMAAPEAHLAKDGALHIGHPVETIFRRAGDQENKCGGAADEQGVDKDGEHLHQALFGRMGDIGGGGGIGRAAHTGFVGKKAALDAKGHTAAGKAAHDGLHVKSRGEDEAEDGGQYGDIAHDDPQPQRHVADGHDGHDHGGNEADAVHAAKDDESGASCQQQPHEQGKMGRLEAAAQIKLKG